MPRVYVNPGGNAFQTALDAEIYVDKTMVVDELNRLVNTKNRFVCMSRPRRFGKSYVGDLICAYYSRGYDSRSLFEGLRLKDSPSFEKYLNKLDVVCIDIGDFYSNFPKERDRLMDVIARKVGEELHAEFPDVNFSDEDTLATILTTIYQHTGRRFVVFIDEYDALIRERVPVSQFDAYLDFLNGLFKGKSTTEAIALAYITGILPIIKDRMQSKLNMFREYTFLKPGPFAEFMGFTEDESRSLCERFHMSYDECKLWYDGYLLKGDISVLSPMSVVEAMERQEFGDYWSQTSTFSVVTDVMKFSNLDFKETILNLVSGEKVRVDISTFRNTMTDFGSVDDVLTFCILLGYLGYDSQSRSCFIPNAEVRKQWEHVAASTESTKVVASLLKESEDLLYATISGDADGIAKGLERAHDAVATAKGYNDENAFQSAISYAYYYAQNAYTVFKELPTGKGFADVAFIPKYPSLEFPAFVLELKVAHSANTAMQQIIDRKYGADLLHYRGNIKLIGVNYDPVTKKHSCEIREMKI